MTITTVNKNGGESTVQYVAYSLADIFSYLGGAYSEAGNIKGISVDGDYNVGASIDNYEDAYITIGTVSSEGIFEEDQKNSVTNSPRFIPNKTQVDSGSILKTVGKIILNPTDA